jgi:hypothetical protein
MKEEDVLMEVCRQGAPSPKQDDLPSIDWDRLVSLAETQRILPLLAPYLAEDKQETLNTRLRALAARWIEQFGTFRTLAQELNTAKIPFLTFKGVALAFTVYPSPEERIFSDIDLLVRPNDLFQVEEILTSLGFEPAEIRSDSQRSAELTFSDSREYIHRESCVSVDLHWRMFKRFYGYNLQPEELFSRAVPIEAEGVSFLTLSPEDHLLFLLLHGSKHLWSKLGWIVDIGLLLQHSPNLEIRSCLQMADLFKVRRTVLLGLALTHRITDVELPEETLNEIKGDSEVQILLQGVLAKLPIPEEPPTLEVIASDVRMREQLLDKFLYILRRGCIPHAEDWRTASLPDPLFFLYYLLRPLRLFWRYILSRSAGNRSL